MPGEIFDWTPSAIQTLEKLWKEGLTTTEIGARLGCGKNSVIGKVHRLALTPRGSPIRRKPAIENPVPPKKPRQAARPAPTTRIPFTPRPIGRLERPLSTEPTPNVVQPQPNTPVDRSKPCCFPTWTEDKPLPKDYCCRPVQVGKNYCPQHYLLCFVVPRSRAVHTAVG